MVDSAAVKSRDLDRSLGSSVILRKTQPAGLEPGKLGKRQGARNIKSPCGWRQDQITPQYRYTRECRLREYISGAGMPPPRDDVMRAAGPGETLMFTWLCKK